MQEQLRLNRVDYIQVGVTSPRTMKLLPRTSEKGTQKIVIGDNTGVLQCIGVRRKEVTVIFKTLPSQPISAMDLGGAIGTERDKVFVAQRNEVHGYSKKGKHFLGFNTNLSESLIAISVHGSDLLACGNFIYSHFVNCRDTNYFLAGDQINDVICLHLENELVPILACKDRTLRVLQDSQLLYQVELPGPASTLSLYYGDGGDDGREVLVGTTNGKIIRIHLGEKATNIWTLDNDKGYGGIVCMHHFDMTGDGVKDLIVGRDDGRVEVYSFAEDDGLPIEKFSYCCNESVTSVQGGYTSSSSRAEIVVVTYPGWVFGLTSEPIEITSTPQTATVSSEASLKLQNLRSEMEDLQRLVSAERENYQHVFSQKGTLNAKAAATVVDVNEKFVLWPEDAAYNLTLETQVPIDNILLQSDVPLDIMDTVKNSAVVSFSQCEPNSGQHVLATYRCQANTTRLDLKIRTIEGQHGIMRVYLTPKLQPKCCQVHHFQIKPLSLHQRTSHFDEDRPLSSLTLRGQFSLAEIHSWVTFCLPDLPERTPATSQVIITFKNTFLQTQLHCSYRKGEAIFKSENISTISILKDVLTKEATTKKIRLEVSCDVNDMSIPCTLRSIHPHLEHQLNLAKKVQLLEPLKDLRTHEGDVGFLAPEFQEILNQEETLVTEYQKQPCRLDRLYGMITDLYIDKFKFRGVNVKSQVPALLQVLEKYSLESLINFFSRRTQ